MSRFHTSLTAAIFCLSLIGLLSGNSRTRNSPIQVAAIGDSHFEPGSPLVTFLGRELGREYRVKAEGRRGWPTRMWISHRRTWRRICRRSDIVLISLSGNDRTQGVPPRVYKENINRLMEWCFEQGAVTFWITRPSDYRPPLVFAPDGIHLNREGARMYAPVLAEIVRHLRQRL